jgi:ATP/maltotriose-dependent transcriptional regulator MalT
MLNGLYLYGYLGNRHREMIGLFQEALDRAISDEGLRGKLLARRWGYLHWLREGDYQEPLASLEQALSNALAENDPFEIAFCHLVTAFAMIGLHRYTDASPHLEASQTLFESVNDPYYVCWVLHRLGYIYYNLNDSDRANYYTEQSLALARVTRNRASLVACLLNLGSHHLLNSGYVKGKAYCEEALQVATESGHAGQTAHALSLLALCAFFQGEYTACADYAHRSMSINETIRPGVFQPYNQSLLILLACLNEDYAEGLRISELGKRLTIDKMGFQLLYWSLAGLSAGLGRPAEIREHLEKLLQVSKPEVNSVTTVWIVPATACMLADTHPERAVELLAWGFTYDDLALNWIRPWSAFERLQTHLQTVIGLDAYETHWEKGQSLSLNAVKNDLQLAFSTESALSLASAEDAPPPILTARELEILHLLAAGLTNPQIAAELVIGAGTVKTHTLSIYRKLDVANRSQAIIRAQALGLLAEV